MMSLTDGPNNPMAESTFIEHQSDVPYNRDPSVADYESGESIVESLTYKKPFKQGGAMVDR